jgi:hypothetical protein
MRKRHFFFVRGSPNTLTPCLFRITLDSKTDSKTGRQQWTSVDDGGNRIGLWSGWKTLVDGERRVMPKGGLEPPRPCEHNALNVACLPISPLRLFIYFRALIPLRPAIRILPLPSHLDLDTHYNTVSLPTCQEFFSPLPLFHPPNYRKASAKAPVIHPGDEAPFLGWGGEGASGAAVPRRNTDA